MALSLRALMPLLLLPVLLSGCSNTPTISFFPGVHRINVLQGNIVTQEKVDQLRLGMSMNQVRFLLGNPLVNDPFNLDQWDYIYNLRDADGNVLRMLLELRFSEGQLVSIEGDYAPASASPADDDLI